MMQLEYSGRRFDIPAGDLGIGNGPDDGIRLEGDGIQPRQAVVNGATDGSAVIRRGSPDATVLVNGVRLGAEPAPLLHGDRVQIGGATLVVADPRTSGSTQFVSAFSPPDAGRKSRDMASTAGTPMSGGRLVSLTDGREYQVPATGLSFGRDAAADVVLEHTQVSRRHAEISFTPRGYVLTDSSTNGTWVNGDRIEGGRLLARGDVLRMGQHEFRFYADAAPPVPAAAAPAPMAPPAGAFHRLNDTMHGLPATPPRGFPSPAAPGPSRRSTEVPLASMLVRSGPLKGQRMTVRSPVVNIGRADYNDVVVPDDSVSSGHAKLQRREGVWILTDQGSTNGTYVDGERVEGEYPLSPGATLRFGKVSVLFEPSDEGMPAADGGTRILEPIRPLADAGPAPAAAPEKPTHLTDERPTPESLPRPEPRPRPVIRRPPIVVTPAPRRSARGWWIGLALLAAAAAAAAYYFLR